MLVHIYSAIHFTMVRDLQVIISSGLLHTLPPASLYHFFSRPLQVLPHLRVDDDDFCYRLADL